MISRDDILSELEKELDDLLATAAEDLAQTTLNAIRSESISYTQRVLYALTTQELQSAGAYNRFVENMVAQARMKMHMR